MKSMGRISQIVVWIIVMISCASRPKNSIEYACCSVRHYALDPSFTLEEKGMVLSSLGAWSEATSGFLCFAPGIDDLVINKADRANYPEKVEEIDKKAQGNGVMYPVGWTENGIAWLLTDRISTNRELFSVSVHELGHLLGLKHYRGAEKSWMHPDIAQDPVEGSKITLRDAIALCRIEGCVPSGP